MKSRTSSCKMTWLKKNLVRFAPFWILYTVCLMLGLFLLSGSRDRFYFIMNLSGCARMMAAVNCGYALLTAQLLFGDLYDSRMCFGIHSLPLRREELFGMNILSGLLFSLIPTAIMTLCALPLAMGSRVSRAELIPFLWFAASNLQYLLFFSLAVFCTMCAGSRFSMAVIYGILNFLSLQAYLMVESLYIPLLNGVSYDPRWFYIFCPAVKITSDPLMLVERLSEADPGKYQIQSGSWLYLLVCAAMGIGLMLLALQMYRKRSLETAGEFIAVKALRPVFLLIFSIFGAMSLNIVARIFFNWQEKILLYVAFALVGLVAGWFVGLMLLKKSPRVFEKRAFLGLAAVSILLGGSLLLTYLDIFGLASWVPEPAQIEKVYVIPGYNTYDEYWTYRNQYAVSSGEELEQVTQMHGYAIGEGLTPADSRWYYGENDRDDREIRYTVPLSLEYHMKNGAVRRRTYFIYADGEAGALARNFYSREEIILENPELLDSVGPAAYINVNGYSVPDQYLDEENTRELLEAIRQDCREGNLAQFMEFHAVPVWQNEGQEIPCINLGLAIAPGTWNQTFYLDVYSDSTHTFRWLRQRGMIQTVIEDAETWG